MLVLIAQLSMISKSPPSGCPEISVKNYMSYEHNVTEHNSDAISLTTSRSWARYRSKRGRTVRAWRRGRHRAWCWRGARRRRWCATRMGFAPIDINRVNSPTFARATAIAGHSPAKPATCGHEWQVDDSRDEAPRIAAPRLTTRERTAPISGDSTVIAPRDEAPAGS